MARTFTQLRPPPQPDRGGAAHPEPAYYPHGQLYFHQRNLTTLPAGRFFTQDIPGSSSANGNDPRPTPVYPDRNSYRLIPYSRLDFGHGV